MSPFGATVTDKGVPRTVVGLDDTFSSKPAPEPFALAALRLALEPRSCVSIGDRIDVDLVPAMDLGMGAILVDGVEDVYRLPDLFAEAFPVPATG